MIGRAAATAPARYPSATSLQCPARSIEDDTHRPVPEEGEMSMQRRSIPAPVSGMRRFLAVAAVVLVGAAGAAAAAAADPVRPPKTFQFALTCTGLGDVLATNLGVAHNEAIQVVGTNTVILFAFNGEVLPDGEVLTSAPGIVTQALAAGTTCTLTAAGPPGALEPVEPPFTFPVVIVNG
jgi:hypothetical protein